MTEDNVEQVAVPRVSPAAVDAITDMLIEEQGILRPPTKAAHLLAIICELHRQGRPFPQRETVAEEIQAAVSTVDAALSTRIDEGYITPRIETKPGNVQRRGSVIRQRYYDPSPRLLTVYTHAENKARGAKARMRGRHKIGA